MGWISDFVSNPVGTVVETVNSAIDTVGNAVTKHPVEVAAVAAGGYYGYGALTAESGAAALAPVSDAGALGVEYLAPVGSNTASTWTTAQVASTVSSGLNLATSGVKLATLGKTMNASTATANGLTGALGPSPIETQSGLITTTPQGPVVAGAQAGSSGFMGMDTQTLLVIAAAMGGIWYLMKHGK